MRGQFTRPNRLVLFSLVVLAGCAQPFGATARLPRHHAVQATTTTTTTTVRTTTTTTPSEPTTSTTVPPVSHCDRFVSTSQNVSSVVNGASAADVVCLHGGTYHQKVTITLSGVVVVNAPNESPIIDGTGVSIDAHDGLWNIEANDVTVEGITVEHSTGRGVVVGGSRNRVIGTTIAYIANAGLLTTNWSTAATDNDYVANTIHDTVLNNACHVVTDPCSATGGWESAINQYDGGSSAAGNNTYRANLVYANNGEGATVMDGDHFVGNVIHDNFGCEIYLDGTQHATIEQNFLYESETSYLPIGINGNQSYRLLGRGIGLADENSPRNANNVIRNNVIVNTRDGIQFWDATSGSGLKNDAIDNNTIVNTWDYGLAFDSGSNFGTVVRDNLIVPRQGSDSRGLSQSGIALAANILTTRGAANDPLLSGEDTFRFDPNAYALGSQSTPAIDHGVASSASVDFVGVPRPQGGGYDVGAFELS